MFLGDSFFFRSTEGVLLKLIITKLLLEVKLFFQVTFKIFLLGWLGVENAINAGVEVEVEAELGKSI